MTKKSQPTTKSQEAVLVTGASGYIGRALTKKLADTGHTVVSMYRNTIPGTLTNVYPVCSDLTNIDLLAVPLRGVDTVIHLAWENTYLGSENVARSIKDVGVGQAPSQSKERSGASNGTGDQKSSNLQCLKNLIAAMEQSKAQRLIFVSAVGCHRKSAHKFLQEKFIAEGLVINSKIKEKVIIRTSLVYGSTSAVVSGSKKTSGGNVIAGGIGKESKDPFVDSIKELLSYPAVYPIPYPKLSLNPTHIDDFVQYLLSVMSEKPQGGNSLVEFYGSEQITTEELVKLCIEKHSQGTKLPIKGAFGSSLLYLLEKSTSQKLTQPSIRQYLAVLSDSKTAANDQAMIGAASPSLQAEPKISAGPSLGNPTTEKSSDAKSASKISKKSSRTSKPNATAKVQSGPKYKQVRPTRPRTLRESFGN